MSIDDDYGIFDYLEETLSKKAMKWQRKIQRNQQPPSSGEPSINQEVSTSNKGYEQTPSTQNPTMQPVGGQGGQQPRKHLLTGDKIRDVGQRMRNHPLFSGRQQTSEQTGEHQEISTTPNSTGILDTRPPQQIGQAAQTDARYNCCTACHHEYQPYDAKVCPLCNFTVPEWARKKRQRSGHDMSLG